MTRYHMWSLSGAHRWPSHLLTCSACVGSKDKCLVGGSIYGAVWLISKAAAKEDPDTPSNLRPIALTSCVGKLFTTILKNRWLSFMVSNGYLDTFVQKAFIPGIPGCLEQYTKLTAAISDAYKNHRSLTVCWLDLANAYGSVHHSLIDYALKHYHAPPCFRRVVSHLYTDLKATFTCASSCKRYDPRLQLCGTDIPFIGDNTISFLGGPINVPQSTSNHRKRLVEKLERLLQRVDAVPVTRKQKLLLYMAGICPRLSWDLSVTTLPLSWVKTTLEVKVTKYLKRWSGLAQPADPARLYLPKTEGGLQLPSLSLLYEKLKSSQASSLLTSHDSITPGHHPPSPEGRENEENQL